MTPSQFTAAQDLIARSDVTPAKTSLGGYAHRMTHLRAAVEAETRSSRQPVAEAPSAPEETA